MPRTKKIQPKKRVRSKVDELNPNQRMFVAELLADVSLSPRQAAINAGYAPKNADATADRLLSNPKVNDLLGKAFHDRLKRTEITQDEVLRFLYDALMLDPLDLFDSDEGGTITLKQLQAIPANIRRLITKIDVKTKKTFDPTDEGEEAAQENIHVKLEWVSKELVLQLVMKHLGMTQQDNVTNVNVGVQINAGNLVQQLRESLASKGKVIDAKAITEMADGN